MEEKEKLQESKGVEGENQVLQYLKQGDFVYELFSVLVHSGSAMGGHYYAYIKSFDDHKWRNYNDSTVSEMSPEEVTKVFGDNYGGSGTAYMLMYRQYNPDNAAKVEQAEEDKEGESVAAAATSTNNLLGHIIPEYLRSEIDEETDKLIKEQKEIEERVLSLKLKVYHHEDNFKVFNMKKTDTLEELVYKVINDFGITEIADNKILENFRFRAYDPKIDAQLAVFDQFSSTLMKLPLFNYFILKVEIKKPDELFEVYDNDTVFLRVLKFVEGVEYNLSKLDLLPIQIISVNKREDTIADLDAKLADLFSIPQEKLVVFLRHGSDRTELYNMEWRKPKKIMDASTKQLDHGAILYVEESDNPKGQLDSFKWHQEFTKEQDKIVIFINNPDIDPNGEVFTIKLEMKKHNTL